MHSRALIVALAICVPLGCALTKPKFVRGPKLRKGQVTEVANFVAPYQQYIAGNFDWPSVRRIVLMPLANQTAYPKASEELQTNLAAELQRAGHFEIVVATRDDPAARSQDVFVSGQFNEMEVLRVAREYQADAVLFTNLTQYHPYAPPRVGLSLLLVSPAEGVAIASISGLWDAREKNTAAQAQADFAHNQNWSRSLRGPERVLESPDVFQRFVSHQIAASLNPSGTGTGTVIGSVPAPGFEMPRETVMPVDGTSPGGMEPPPAPPASFEMQ